MREAGGCLELKMPGNPVFSEIEVHIGLKVAR